MNLESDLTRILSRLPTAAHGCRCGWVNQVNKGLDAVLSYRYFEKGVEWECSLLFTDVVALRFADEFHHNIELRKDFDSLVEVLDSSWMRQLNTTRKLRFDRVHYRVHLPDVGVYDFIAASFEERLPVESSVL